MPNDEPVERWLAELVESGYVRAVVGERTESIEPALAKRLKAGQRVMIVLDRLVTGEAAAGRLRESLEGAFAAGGGAAVVLVEEGTGCAKPQAAGAAKPQAEIEVDGKRGGGWFSARRCGVRSVGSIIRSRSRSCLISIGRWGRVRRARGSATS